MPLLASCVTMQDYVHFYNKRFAIMQFVDGTNDDNGKRLEEELKIVITSL